MASFGNPKSLLVALPVLIAAALLVLLVKPFLDAERVSNLDLSNPGVADLYIMLDPSTPGWCTVTDRRESTIRRSDNPDDRRNWTFQRGRRTADPAGLHYWVVRTRRSASFLLVPVEDVRDWAFPYFYRFVRSHEGRDRMPSVRWNQLFVNRIYRGLFLRIELPFDPPLDRGGMDTPYELLAVAGNTMGCMDRQIRTPCAVYAQIISDGNFPEPAPPSPLVGWLAGLVTIDEFAYLLQGISPYPVMLVPLPVSIRDVYEQVNPGELTLWQDDRFLSWSIDVNREVPASEIFTLPMLLELQDGWSEYHDAFALALEVHCSFHQSWSVLSAELGPRLDERGQRIIAIAGETQ